MKPKDPRVHLPNPSNAIEPLVPAAPFVPEERWVQKVDKISPREVMRLAQSVTFADPKTFFEEVSPATGAIFETIQTAEFKRLAKESTIWKFMYQLTSQRSNVSHYILGSNHGISYDRIVDTENNILRVAELGLVKNAWTEIDPETALPKTFDMRIINKLRNLTAVKAMETTSLHDVILNNLSNLLVEHVRTSIDTMTEMVKQLNRIVADLFVAGNADLNWFMYRMSWMLLMGERGYEEHEEVLLQERNVEWARRVIPELNVATESHIIVCGCNHLFGHLGMLQLLQNGGWDYEVVPIIAKPPVADIPFDEFTNTLKKIETENRQNSRLARPRNRPGLCTRWLKVPLLCASIGVLLFTLYIVFP